MRIALTGLVAAAVAVNAQVPARPALVGLDHVAFKVSDVPAAQAFYGELLGYPVVVPRGAGGTLVVRVNRRQSILLEPGLTPQEDDRLSHIALATPDLSAMKGYLDARGVTSDGPAERTCGRVGLRLRDPDGNTIEFVQEQVIVAAPADATHGPVSARLYHTGVAVRDEARAHTFYREVLGFEEIWRGGADPARASWVNMRLPDSTDYIEYMLNDKPPTRQQLGSQHHACLLVPDMQAAWEAVRARTPTARRAALQKPRIGRNNKWQLNLFDGDGTRVELMEPFPTRIPAPQ
jgi:lactoylglutathione lyase